MKTDYANLLLQSIYKSNEVYENIAPGASPTAED